MKKTIAIALLATLCGCSSGDGPSGPWPPLKDHAFPLQEYAPRWPTAVAAGVARGEQLLIADHYALFKSSDGGRNWHRAALETDAQVLAVATSDDGSELLAITEDGGEHRSGDGGRTWTRTSIYDRLPMDMERLERYWDGYSLYHASVSRDLEHWIVVGFCEGFVSHDGGQSFERVTGNNGLGSWDHDDLCLEELIVDEEFQPLFASVEVTGKLASGEYVYALRGERWEELCSFDLMALLLESVTECDDVAIVKDNARLLAHSDSYAGPWDLDVDPDAAVFEERQLLVRDDVDPDVVPRLIVNEAGKHWFVSYLGVAASADRGRQWVPLIGGIPSAEREASLSDDEHLAVWDDRVFRSSDRHVWSRVAGIEYAYDFVTVDNVALVATSNGGVVRFAAGGAPEKVLDNEVYQLHVSDDLVWATAGGWIAASRDMGRSWSDVRADTVDDGEWTCAQTCVAVDDYGRSWVAAAGNDGITIETTADLSESLAEDNYTGPLWAAPDHSLLVLEVGNFENEEIKLWVSGDQARSWKAFPQSVAYVDHLIFPESGTAFVEGGGEAHWIRDRGAVMESDRSPVPVESGIACSPAPGQVALETWDFHPEWPDEDALYAVYTLDMGESWWTMRTDESICPQDY